jgi:hypothetical protein
MATFIQGVTDTNLDPVLFTPDYSFLRYNLEKKNAQYEQGLKSVSSAYGALKKELSDPTNIVRRDNYLKAAENELQKIASADLSLQQNVNAANAIFDPIATDPAIAFDAYHTSRIKRELSEMESWSASDDMATRKKFNKDIYDWLRRDMESLKTGNGNINNYKVQGRKAWAFVDAQDIINAAAKEAGFKVENDELGKPYIVTTINGVTHRSNYETFGKSVLDANPVYQQQLQILGQAKVEKTVERAMTIPEYAGLTKDQVLERFTDKEYDFSGKRQKEYLQGLNDKLSVQTAEYKSFVEKNAANISSNPQGEEAQRAQVMAANLTQYKAQIDQVQSEYTSQYGSDQTSYKAKKEEFKKRFLTNPEGYYANQAMMEDVIRFSNIRSAFGTRSIKVDQGYISMLNAADKARNTLNNIADDKFDNQMDIEELELKKINTAAKLSGKDPSGSTKKNADGTEKLANIEFSGISSTQVNKTTKIDQLNDRLALSEANAIQNMTGTFGGLYLLEKMGAKPEDVGLVRQFFTRKATEKDAKPSSEEIAALKNTYQTMWAWAKTNENQNQEFLGGLRETVKNKVKYADIDYAGLLKTAAKNYEPKDQYESQAKRALFDYDKNQAEVKRISAAVSKGVQVVVNTIATGDDKELKNFVVKDGDGYRMINNEDVKKWFKDRKTILKYNGNLFNSYEWVPLTNEILEEISKGYLSGTLKYKGIRTGSSTQDRFNLSTGEYIIIQNHPVSKVGVKEYFPVKPQDVPRVMKRINEKIPIPEFETAIAGAGVEGSASFIIRNEDSEKIRGLLTSPTQENSNIFVVGSGSATDYVQADPEMQKAARIALTNKNNVEQVKIFTTSPINEGKQVIEVTFAPKKSEKDESLVAGQVMYFPINITGRSPEVLKIFADVDDMDEFMEYSKNNKPYTMDYHEGSGVKAVIYADKPGSKTGTVRLYSKYDPVTRQYTDNWIEQPPIPFDLNRVTFSEMKDEIYNNFLDPYMQRRMNHNKQAASNQSSGTGTTLLNQLKNVVKW